MYKLVFKIFYVPVIFCFIGTSQLSGQLLQDERSADWTLAGIQNLDYAPCYVINIMDHGADSLGVQSSDDALQSALALLSGDPGIIYFPPGIFYFESAIVLESECILRGAGSNQTTLQFNLGGTGNCVEASGSFTGVVDTLVESARKGNDFIRLGLPQNFVVGDYIRLFMDDLHLVNDNWARNTVMHFAKIVSKSGDTIFLDQELRHEYSLLNYSRIQKILPVKNIGIENLKIKRLDVTSSQSKNLFLRRAVECWVKGVESEMCNFGHIVIEMSAYCEITGCHIHHAFDYGSGGKAYGVVLQQGTSLTKIENNIFHNLRHAMLLQSGVNGNVIAYNYSQDPVSSPDFPPGSSGDIVFHGNYPFLNLIEGNVCQNLRIDQSHGKNGPFNTIFRNRTNGYGFIMANSPASDSQNIVGLEITNSGLFLGPYTINGSGHFVYGNNVLGTNQPNGTTALSDTSYAYTSIPPFLTQASGWPLIGYPNALNTHSIPAEDRFIAGVLPYTVPQDSYEIQSDSIFWTGCAGSDHWGEPRNWSSLSLPISTSHVIIRSPVRLNDQMPVISTETVMIKSIKILQPNILQVLSSGYLETKE